MIKPTIIWICLLMYVCFLTAVAISVTKKEGQSKGSKVLSAKVAWPVLVMTYVASLMSVWVFFAGPGAYYRGGIGYWLSEMSYIALFPVVAHFTMNKVWLVNKMKGDTFVTPADFYDERFKSPALRVILGILFLITSFPYISSVLMAIGQAAQFATGGAVPYKAAVLGCGMIMTVFVSLGGTKSAAMADTIQGLVFISVLWAIVIICVVIGFGGSFSEPITVLKREVPQFFSYPGPDNWVSYASRFGYPFSCAIGWTIMLPHVFVRSGYFGDELKAQRRLLYCAPILQAVVWTGTMCVGLVGLALVQNLKAGDTELLIPYLINQIIYDSNPLIAKILMLTFFVGTCAVGLSTANAFLSVSSAIISIDFIEKTFKMKIPESKKLLENRIIIAVVGVISTVLALDPPDLIFTLIMFAIAIVMPLFPILVMGIYWKKATGQAAVAASIVGTVLVLLTYFSWGIGDTYYGVIGMIGATVTMVIVSRFTKQNNAEAFFELLEKGQDHYYKRK